MTVIKDGTGTGNIAGVNSVNQLGVEAMVEPEAAFATDLGVAWVVDGQVFIFSGVERTIMIITNSGITPIEIGRTITSVQNSPPSSGMITIIRTYLGNAAITSSYTSKTPVNTNTQFTTIPNVGVVTNTSGVGTVTTGTDTEISQVYFFSTDSIYIDYNETLFLNQGGSYRVTAQGVNTIASGFIANHTVQFFEEFHTG